MDFFGNICECLIIDVNTNTSLLSYLPSNFLNGAGLEGGEGGDGVCRM